MKWLFIDIGGPIIDDGIWKEYLDLLLINAMRAAGIEISSGELASVRRRVAERKAEKPTVAAISEFTTDEKEAIRLFGEAYERLKSKFQCGEDIPRFLTENASAGLTRLSKDYRLATLSNNISKVRYLLDITGVTGFFDRHFISEEVGAAKPDKAIFAAALQGTGIAPSQGMMVGDRLDNDIEPARRVGMRTAIVNKECGGPGGREEEFIDVDIRCSDLLELARTLKTSL